MPLFDKQEFNPSLLSMGWFAMKLRPNMLIYCQDHVEAILESGLLFREDSVEIEQEVIYYTEEGYNTGLFTTGEKVASGLALTLMFALDPIKSLRRGSWWRLAGYAAAPALLRWAHRRHCAGSVRTLLEVMCEYLTVARRSAACCREYATLYSQLESVATVVDSTQSLLIQQQAAMVNTLSRASSTVLGNAPWLQGDVAWEAVCRPGDSLMKIHHTFLVVQSLLLKHLAMAHYLSNNSKKVYKNHNERIYWLHNVVIKYLIREYMDNYEALERMYRLLKNCAKSDNSDKKTPGSAICSSWLYSDVHLEVAKTCLELKLAQSKCCNIDIFLDACGVQNSDVNLEVLNEDIEDLIGNILRSLSSAQNSQKRLKKLQNKDNAKEPNTQEEVIEEVNVVKIEDKDPEAKDEVFYFMKTDEDETAPQAADVVTGPGVKEKEASKVVMSELKRKLGKREDLMRERERQALKKTMPEYKDNVPEFPRQIEFEEFVEKKGFCKKISRGKPKKKLFKYYKIGGYAGKRIGIFKKGEKYLMAIGSYVNAADIMEDLYEANANLSVKTEEVSIIKDMGMVIVTKWRQIEGYNYGALYDADEESVLSGRSEHNTAMDGTRAFEPDPHFSYTRHDLDLSPSSSEEETRGRLALLDIARKQRESRKYNAGKPSGDEIDESLKPIEYRFGTGMAMASVLQGHKMPIMAQEEVYIGDGEVSDDSGNSGED